MLNKKKRIKYNPIAAEGIEPPTLRVWTVRSSQLSYTAKEETLKEVRTINKVVSTCQFLRCWLLFLLHFWHSAKLPNP